MVAGFVRPPDIEGPAPRYPIESVDKALQLLLLFAERPRVRLTDAADYLEVASSTAHRLLAMLQYRGFIQQDATRAYEAGPVLRNLACASQHSADLSGVARPVLERLFIELGTPIHLGRLDGQRVVFVEGVNKPPLASPSPGEWVPAHCSSIGKVMLSQLRPEEVRALYPQEQLDQRTYRSHASRQALEDDLERVRRRGFAICDEECEIGVASVAVALPGLTSIRYGVMTAMPVRRLTTATRGGAVRALTDAAAELSSLV
jgi:DNA-binding IclR family transcriptional regulator